MNNEGLTMECLLCGTLNELVNGSEAVADFLRDFPSDDVVADLEFLAVMGKPEPQWLRLRGGLICLLHNSEPLTYYPVRDRADVPLRGHCANECGAALLAATQQMIFRGHELSVLAESGNFFPTCDG